MGDISNEIVPLQASDGHRWELLATIPANPQSCLLWLPAMGVPAKHYLPFSVALAARGVATFVHEWRGLGSSSLRASRQHDWGYNELLSRDLPASEAAIAARFPGVERILGGHSLGGQLACCHLALVPHAGLPAPARRLWLVASGAPYWRAFPAPTRYGLPLAYRFLPWLADRHGVLPGRRLGFAGQEARGVIADWARTAISGRYAAAGLQADRSRVAAPAATDRHASPVPPASRHADPEHPALGRTGPMRARWEPAALAQADPEQADLTRLDLDHAYLDHAYLDHAYLDHADMEHAGLNPAGAEHLDLERALQRVHAQVDAVLLQDDWLAPPPSLQFLLAKLTAPGARVAVLDAATLGARADHFAWMQQPRRVIDHLLG